MMILIDMNIGKQRRTELHGMAVVLGGWLNMRPGFACLLMHSYLGNIFMGNQSLPEITIITQSRRAKVSSGVMTCNRSWRHFDPVRYWRSLQ